MRFCNAQRLFRTPEQKGEASLASAAKLPIIRTCVRARERVYARERIYKLRWYSKIYVECTNQFPVRRNSGEIIH